MVPLGAVVGVTPEYCSKFVYQLSRLSREPREDVPVVARRVPMRWGEVHKPVTEVKPAERVACTPRAHSRSCPSQAEKMLAKDAVVGGVDVYPSDIGCIGEGTKREKEGGGVFGTTPTTTGMHDAMLSSSSSASRADSAGTLVSSAFAVSAVDTSASRALRSKSQFKLKCGRGA